MYRKPSVSALLPVALASLLALSACGSGGEDTAATSEADTAAVTEGAESSATDPSAEEAPAESAEISQSSGIELAESDLGPILVDGAGNTLYGFTDDVGGESSCNGDCAEAWPPVTASDDLGVGEGLDEANFSTTTREDGSTQLVAGDWPLYYFAGDDEPGQTNGQASGDVWFVVNADGSLNDGSSGDSMEGEMEEGTMEEGEADSMSDDSMTDEEAPTEEGEDNSLY